MKRYKVFGMTGFAFQATYREILEFVQSSFLWSRGDIFSIKQRQLLKFSKFLEWIFLIVWILSAWVGRARCAPLNLAMIWGVGEAARCCSTKAGGGKKRPDDGS